MAGNPPQVGILALQGDFAKHAEALSALGVQTCLIRRHEQLSAIDALVLPGGESTALLRLLTPEFREALCTNIRSGLPTLATCAGAILLAHSVQNPSQDSFDLINIIIARNDYGRQKESFIAKDIPLTAKGETAIQYATRSDSQSKLAPLTGIFIRAPRILSCGAEVDILATHQDDPVLVRQEHIILATFHPELTQETSVVHQLLLAAMHQRNTQQENTPH